MLPLFNTLYLETTRKCNFDCKYCSSGSNGKKDQGEDLPFDVICDRILKPAWNLGTRLVDFSGGEFLMREDAYDLLEFADKLGFIIGVASNGSNITPENLQKIRDAVGDNVIVSLGINSFDEENVETREVNEVYIARKLELLRAFHIRTNISITIGQFNKHSFKDTVEKTRKLGVPFNRIPFVPRSCDAYHLMPDKNAIRDYFHPVLRKHFNGQVSYTPYFLNPEIYTSVSGQSMAETPVPTNPPIACWVGAYYAINPEGEVSPCPMFLDHVSGGNVLKDNLRDILFESELFKRIVKRDELKGKCGNCRYTFTCGGCRVLAYYVTGDVYAEDPICFIDELSPDELQALEAETTETFRNYLRMASFGKIYRRKK